MALLQAIDWVDIGIIVEAECFGRFGGSKLVEVSELRI